MAFPGVGRKVADCVALFALDQHGAVPVDTHVWNIACRHFDPGLKASAASASGQNTLLLTPADVQDAKSLTPSVYAKVGDEFRRRLGPYAGWAHWCVHTWGRLLLNVTPAGGRQLAVRCRAALV